MKNEGLDFYARLKNLEGQGLSNEDIGTIIARNWQRQRLTGLVAVWLGFGFGLFLSCTNQTIGDRKLARELAKKMK